MPRKKSEREERSPLAGNDELEVPKTISSNFWKLFIDLVAYSPNRFQITCGIDCGS